MTAAVSPRFPAPNPTTGRRIRALAARLDRIADRLTRLEQPATRQEPTR